MFQDSSCKGKMQVCSPWSEQFGWTTWGLQCHPLKKLHSIFDRGEQTTDGPKDVLGHLCCYMDCAPAMRKYPVCRHFVKGTV
uniref:Uncharacterized protein n=1 Tax=Magallana gigas TaxID=29159 RepID=A0A8W8JHC7_MAGGI